MKVSICSICGSDRQETVLTQVGKDDYLELIGVDSLTVDRKWVKCMECGIVYHSPQLEEKELELLYDRFRDSEWRKETPDEYFDRISGLSDLESENSVKLSLLLRYIPQVVQRSNGAFLDIGCGGGVLIQKLKSQQLKGWQSFGIEPTKSFAKLAARRSGSSIHIGQYLGDHFSGRKFDLITCCQVLEHVDRPQTFLRNIYWDLAASGVLYLEVPDISDFSDLPSDHDRFMMQHINYFEQNTLRSLVSDCGFVMIKCGLTKTIRSRNNLWMMLSKI